MGKRYTIGDTNRLAPKRRRKRLFGPLIITAAVLLLAGELIRSNWFPEVTHTRIALPGYPAEFDGLRVAHVSDLHGQSFGQDNETVLRMVEAEQPDLIVITGDLIDGYAEDRLERQLTWAYTQLERLTRIAPVYYVTGNHEWGADYLAAREGRRRPVPRLKTMMDSLGVHWMDNQYLTLERGDATIVIAGLIDPNGPADQQDPAPLMARIRGREEDAFILMLSHRYDRLDEYEALGLDLVLTGHAHGGVIRLPFTEGLYGPGRDFLPKHTGGVYRQGDTVMAVSRGLGDTYPRMWNRPEIAVYTLVKE